MDFWKEMPLAFRYRTLIRRAEKNLNEMDETEEDWDELEELIYELKEYIVLNDKHGAEVAKEELQAFLER